MTTPALVSRGTNRFRSPSSLAGAAALAALAAPSLVQAQIAWSGTLNGTVNSGTPQFLLDLNLNSTPDNPEAYLVYSEFKGDVSLTVADIADSKTDPSTVFLYANSPVAFGAAIDHSYSYQGSHPAALVPADGQNYYYAFEYQGSGGPYYGWMELNLSADQQTGTLVQWAYNTTAGAGLTAGQTTLGSVPEPSATAAMIGLAALGTLWWRKKLRPAPSR